MGLIWLATVHGLFRYDGCEFKAIGEWYEEKQVSDFNVLDLKQDSRGCIWMSQLSGGSSVKMYTLSNTNSRLPQTMAFSVLLMPRPGATVPIWKISL